MAPATFDAHERSPERMLRCKPLACDEPGPLDSTISAGNLWSKRQEQFIQEPLGKEISHQLRPTLDQDHLTLADTVHLLQDSLGTE